MQVCGTVTLGFIVTQDWKQTQAIEMSFCRMFAAAYLFDSLVDVLQKWKAGKRVIDWVEPMDNLCIGFLHA
jgi:hypothetical protein